VQASTTTEARLLADGRWVYQRSYECPDCGATFTEQKAQHVEPS
jgi:acetone carboxylase gamma subunit